MTAPEVKQKIDMIPAPEGASADSEKSAEKPEGQSKLPLEAMVQKQGEAITKIMGYLRAKNIDETERKNAIGKWNAEYSEARTKFYEKTQIRRGFIGTLGYVAISALITAAIHAPILAGGAAIAGLPIIASMAGYLPLIFGGVIRTMPFWRNFEEGINKFFDKNVEEAQHLEEVNKRNPMSPENMKILEFNIAQKIRNGVQGRANGQPIERTEVRRDVLPQNVLQEMKAIQAVS